MKNSKLIGVVFLSIFFFIFQSCEKKSEAKDELNTSTLDSLLTDTIHINPFIDSLKILGKSNTGKSKIDVINRLAEEYRNVDLKTLNTLWQDAYSRSEKLGYSLGKAEALNNKAIFYYKQTFFDSALVFMDQSLALANSSGDSKTIARSLSWKAEVYRAMGKEKESEELYNKALGIAQKNKDDFRSAFCFTFIGTIYRSQLNYEKMFYYANKAIKCAEKAGYYSLVAVNNGFIGDVYKHKGLTDSAKQYYKKVIDITWKIKNYNSHSLNATNLAEIYRIEYDFSHALDYYYLSIKSAEKINDKLRLAYIYTSIGECYRVSQQDYVKAESYYNKALVLGDGIGDQNYCFAKFAIAESYIEQKNMTRRLIFY